MKLVNKIKTVCLLTVLIPCVFTNAVASESGMNFSIRVLNGNYSGKNKTTDTEFQSNEGAQLGLNLAYQYSNFYTGLNLQGGTYTFEKQAPDQVTPSGRTQVSNDKLTHSELDLVFGYFITSRISIFIDFKGTSDTWESNQHKQEFSGAGLGITGNWPLNENWTIYGSYGAISSGEVKYNGEKYGTGKARSLDVGALYKFTDNHRLTFGVRGTRYVYEYDTGDEQVHNIGGGYIGYNYAFAL